VDELQLLAGIQRLIKRELPAVEVAGFGFDPNVKPEPIANGRQRQQGRNAQRRQDERRPSANRTNGNVAHAKPVRRPDARPAGEKQKHQRREPRRDDIAPAHSQAAPYSTQRRREVPALFTARRGDNDGNR
jgi:ATP-dependent RNA helicase RhlE